MLGHDQNTGRNNLDDVTLISLLFIKAAHLFYLKWINFYLIRLDIIYLSHFNYCSGAPPKAAKTTTRRRSIIKSLTTPAAIWRGSALPTRLGLHQKIYSHLKIQQVKSELKKMQPRDPHVVDVAHGVGLYHHIDGADGLVGQHHSVTLAQSFWRLSSHTGLHYSEGYSIS